MMMMMMMMIDDDDDDDDDTGDMSTCDEEATHDEVAEI